MKLWKSLTRCTPSHNLRTNRAGERSCFALTLIWKAPSLTRSRARSWRVSNHASCSSSVRRFGCETLQIIARCLFYQTIGTCRWFETLAASQNWVSQQEELRLENQRRPNTQWSYEKTEMVYVKVILDRHPLFLGLGRLPDWLRNKHGVLSLDTYRDNRCLFRCIAVHWGAHVRDNMRKTRELEEAFFAQRPGLRNRLTDKHLPLLEKHFKQGIAAYTVQPNGEFVLTHLPANYDKVGRPVLIMGLYDGHAFLIQTSNKSRVTTLVGIVRLALQGLTPWFVTQQVGAAVVDPRFFVLTTESEFPPQPTSELSTPRPVAASLQSNGSSGRQSSGVSTFITHGAAMGVSDTSSTFQLTVITPKPTLSSSTTAAIGTGASSAIRSPLSDRRWCGGTNMAG